MTPDQTVPVLTVPLYTCVLKQAGGGICVMHAPD